ncbi:acyltransferase family protein [Actinocatenispora rupis]|uniref:Acyltransferase n=1 Tax=Actinocatenispora rupis TaxID=519421 RepID=A0A8J3N8P2_9ACTN|nr:acyltransferase family protein [Actinocatenispora rupis]GID10519.1 acyltransferase [Actinocatenispora rupis]
MTTLVTPAVPRQATRRGAPRTAGSPVAGRDRFVDAVRAFGTLAVLVLHWLIPVVAWDGHRLDIGNALSGGYGWVVTWPLQVIPLMFFAAGAGAWWSRRHATEVVPFLRRRLGRLMPPVVVFLATWAVVIAPACLALGVPLDAVRRAAGLAPQLLWFVAVYLLLLVVTPALLRAYSRWGLRVAVVLAGAAVAVDLARFAVGGPSWLGYLNVLCVWLVPYLLGFAYADGTLGTLRRRTLALVGAGAVATLAALVAAGPYPPSMVGLPGDAMSNMNPPTVCLLLVTVYQVAAVLLLRGAVLRALDRPVVSRVVGYVQARSMTLYLWHLTAMFVVVGVVLFGLHRALPAAWTAQWWLTRPLWYAGLLAVLAVLVRLFARVETVGVPARLAVHARTAAGYAGVACLLAAVLIAITKGTLATATFGPQALAAALLALGLALTALSRTGRAAVAARDAA